jgi:peptidoglycan/xylan/chitin deacetylase (PgdA/CDA1 family)
MSRQPLDLTTSGFSIPVLLYHSISTTPHDRMAVPPALFEEHLALLREEFFPIALGDALQLMTSGESPPERAVAVTFDDGYRDNYEAALPLLSRHSISATFFVCPSHLGHTNDWNTRAFARRRHLAAQEVCELQKHGHEIGSHGLSHHYLPKLASDEQLREIAESKRRLANLCEIEIRFFAYPYGDPDDRILAIIGGHYALAFRTSRTASANWRTAPFEIPRLTVKSDELPEALAERLHCLGDPPQGLPASHPPDAAACAAIVGLVQCASIGIVGQFSPRLPAALAQGSRGGQRLWICDISPDPYWQDGVAARNALGAAAAGLSVTVVNKPASLQTCLEHEPCFLWIGAPGPSAGDEQVVRQMAALISALPPQSTACVWTAQKSACGDSLRCALNRRSANCLQLSEQLLIAKIP